MQDKIICLVGPSGSGKTTIAKELEKEGYNIIHSYTTREPREEGEWGHIFIDRGMWHGSTFKARKRNDVAIAIPTDELIAYKKLYQEYYFATKEQYKDKGTSIYVVDPDGAKQVKENVKDAKVITIFLMSDMRERDWRMKEDGRKYVDRFNRIEKDKEIFKTCKCDYVIDANRELEEVVKDVIEIIEGEI